MNLQKKLIPLACLSLLTLGTAQAQSTNDVTVYGRANLTAESQKVGTRSESVLVDNQSRLGVRAKRTIGGGLSVGANLEAGVNFTDGVTNPSGFFARAANVGISSAEFGEIKLGRMLASTAYFATADYVSNHNHDTGSSADALFDGLAVGALKNAIGYTAPKIGNLQLEAQYGLKYGTGVNGSDSRKVNPLSISANYNAGPLALGLGYEQGPARGSDGSDIRTKWVASTNNLKAVTARAFYTMGNIGFGGYVQQTSGKDNANGNANYDRTAYRLSAMYTMGKNEFHANTGSASDRGSVANTGASQFTLGFNHNLDKQTKIYTFYTQVKNQSAAVYNPGRVFLAPKITTEQAGQEAGQDISSIGVGLRYNF